MTRIILFDWSSKQTQREEFWPWQFLVSADRFLHDGIIEFGKTTLKVIVTLDHIRGSISRAGKEKIFIGARVPFAEQISQKALKWR